MVTWTYRFAGYDEADEGRCVYGEAIFPVYRAHGQSVFEFPEKIVQRLFQGGCHPSKPAVYEIHFIKDNSCDPDCIARLFFCLR